MTSSLAFMSRGITRYKSPGSKVNGRSELLCSPAVDIIATRRWFNDGPSTQGFSSKVGQSRFNNCSCICSVRAIETSLIGFNKGYVICTYVLLFQCKKQVFVKFLLVSMCRFILNIHACAKISLTISCRAHIRKLAHMWKNMPSTGCRTEIAPLFSIFEGSVEGQACVNFRFFRV